MLSPGEDFWCSRVPWWHYMSLKSYREGDLPPEHDVEFPSAPSPLFAHSHGSSQDSGPSLPHITSQASWLRASPWKYGEGFDSIYLGPVESCQPAWYSEVRHKFHGLTPRPGSLGPMIKVANSWKLVTCQNPFTGGHVLKGGVTHLGYTILSPNEPAGLQKDFWRESRHSGRK